MDRRPHLPARSAPGQRQYPRCFGAISAWNQGFDAVAYPGVDNWYAPDHIASVLGLCRRQDFHLAFSERHIVLQDDTILGIPDPDDAARINVETSCMFFT
jgi:hypothetical protein